MEYKGRVPETFQHLPACELAVMLFATILVLDKVVLTVVKLVYQGVKFYLVVNLKCKNSLTKIK